MDTAGTGTESLLQSDQQVAANTAILSCCTVKEELGQSGSEPTIPQRKIVVFLLVLIQTETGEIMHNIKSRDEISNKMKLKK